MCHKITAFDQVHGGLKEPIELGKQYPDKSGNLRFCHPFFTGKKILLDSAGRVEKFNRKFAKRKPKTETVKTEEVKVEEVKAEEVKTEETSTEASS